MSARSADGVVINYFLLIALIAAILAFAPSALQAQGFSGAVVTAPASILVSGQQMQLQALARDTLGNPRNGDQFVFRSSNTGVLNIDAAGVATARNPGVSNITATIQGTNFTSPSVQIEVIPLRIDINSPKSVVDVGDSLQLTASAVDVNEQPIPATFRWQVTGANGFNTRAATIGNDGILYTSGMGLMTIHAQILYSGYSADQLPMFEGLALIDIRAKKEYKLTRMLANMPLQKSFVLRPSFDSDPGINDSGQAAFVANLDGLSNALMFYENGNFQVVASGGTPGPMGGYIWEFAGPPAINNKGDFLVRVGTSNGWGFLRASKTSGLMYFMENGTAEGLGRMSYFRVGRYSINDQGDILFLSDFQYVGEPVWHTGLFLINDQGFRYVVSNTDTLPAFPSIFTFDNSFFGVDNRGTVYFRVMSGSNSAIFRTDGSSDPVKIAGTGTNVGGVQLQDVQGLALSPGGSIAFTSNVNGGSGIVRLRSGQRNLEFLSERYTGQILSINDSGDTLYIADPGRDPWWGMYVWQAVTASQVLRFGVDSLEGGEKPGWARVGKITPSGQIFASFDSPQNHYVVARLDGTRRTLWRVGTIFNQRANLNFQGLVPGAQSGPVHTFGGGGNASILEVASSGPRGVWTPGDRTAVAANSMNFTMVSKSPGGDVYLTFWDGIVRNTNGNYTTLAQFPFDENSGGPGRPGVTVRGPSGWYDGNNAFSVNSSGTFVFNAWTDRDNRIEMYDRGIYSAIMVEGGPQPTSSPGGGTFSGIVGATWRQNSIALDERGRVLVNAFVTGGPSGLFLYDNKRWTSAALFNQTIIDGGTVRSCRGIHVADGLFYAMLDFTNGDFMIASYDGQKWTPLVNRDDTLPDGTTIGFLNNMFAVNRQGEIAYMANANGLKIVLRGTDGAYHLIYSEMTPTDDGDLFPNQLMEFDLRDNGLLYFYGVASSDQSMIYKAQPIR